MSEIITVGLDLAKNVFQAHGADASGRAVLRKKLRRDQVVAFFSQLPPCVVAMEACGGAHFWGRAIGKLGHEVRLIPPAGSVALASSSREMPVSVVSCCDLEEVFDEGDFLATPLVAPSNSAFLIARKVS
jgi:hypothetical protein